MKIKFLPEGFFPSDRGNPLTWMKSSMNNYDVFTKM